MATNYEKHASTPEDVAWLVESVRRACKGDTPSACHNCPLRSPNEIVRGCYSTKCCAYNGTVSIHEWLQEEADDTKNA